MKTTTIVNRNASLAAAKALIEKSQRSTTKGKDYGPYTPEMWEAVDNLNMTEEQAKAILEHAVANYPVTREDTVATDVAVTAWIAPYDKRKQGCKALFEAGREMSTLDRIMEKALEAKISLSGNLEGVKPFFGIKLGKDVFRTGPQANVALAVSKALAAEPVMILVPLEDEEIVEM